MAEKQIALEAAAFLDSPQARALAAPREDVRRIAEDFLAACYEDLGKKPRLLDGQDAHVVLGHLLPRRMERGDRLAAHVPAVLAAFVEHLEATQIVPEAFELKRGLAATEGEFLEAVRTGRDAHAHAAPAPPFVHGAPKLGRNDPCSCGSGKKFKKCHGRE
jgi:preprotein translocase subunit SecA